MNKILTASLCVAAAYTSPALADELWTSPEVGEIRYDIEYGDIAVFSFQGAEPGTRALMYIIGVAGNYDNRGTYQMYWIDPSGISCAAQLVGVDGLASYTWGSGTITFDQPAFPTGWTAQMGLCFDDPTGTLRADAM